MSPIGLIYNASPSKSIRYLKQGTAGDLRRDRGGLFGSGFSFISEIADEGDLHCSLTWDLSQAPEDLRVIWTYSEGPSTTEKPGDGSILRDFVYMVGSVLSNPSQQIPGSKPFGHDAVVPHDERYAAAED
ncbi:hypothetical protein BJ878DRAFT_539598 [Calycina marina]|uniref:Uncharacterized protein n=1 Tax=Calycina marina TaxID=1763456 RepID=A0A9P8CHB9_9HELO|nr:hypothetical protein BJ878DRAFT_539598 [Calycina marina]